MFATYCSGLQQGVGLASAKISLVCFAKSEQFRNKLLSPPCQFVAAGFDLMFRPGSSTPLLLRRKEQKPKIGYVGAVKVIDNRLAQFKWESDGVCQNNRLSSIMLLIPNLRSVILRILQLHEVSLKKENTTQLFNAQLQ